MGTESRGRAATPEHLQVRPSLGSQGCFFGLPPQPNLEAELGSAGSWGSPATVWLSLVAAQALCSLPAPAQPPAPRPPKRSPRPPALRAPMGVLRCS